MSTIVAQICIRRDTAANFTSANPTLALGEIAYETDTRNIKVGDGATAWTALGYINPYRGGTAAAPTSNTVLGSGAGAALTGSSADNTILGFGAGANTTGTRNVHIGYQAGGNVTTQGEQVNIGWQAGQLSTGGFRQIHIGFRAGWRDGGSGNVAIGDQALSASTGGVNCAVIGAGAASLNTASDITAVGAYALDANTTGTNNTAVGKDALGACTTGTNSTAVGLGALASATSPNWTTALGSHALSAYTSGNANTALGESAFRELTGGAHNLAVGESAGRFAGAGSTPATSLNDSIFVGRLSRANTATDSNTIVIGHNVVGNGSNTTTIGNSSTTGTFIPAGDLTLTNGNFIIGTSGKGIDFSATSEGTGTMTSELFSDYEEGTWTPDLQFGGANTAITYESRNGTYTKIGRQVTARGYIKLTSNGTATGDAAIAALPFTSNSASNHHNTGPIAASNVTTATQVVSILLANGTSILLNEFVSGGVVAALNDTDISDTAIMTFQITYFT